MALVRAERIGPSHHAGKYLSMIQRAQSEATALNRGWAHRAIAQTMIDEMRLMGDEEGATELERQLAASPRRGTEKRSETASEALRRTTKFGATATGFDPDLP